MNDFPSMEDRSARAAENLGSASRSDATSRTNGNFNQDRPSAGLGSNQNIRRIMNRQNNQQHEVIVSGIHLELTPSLKTFVREKSERLFRHEERIMRLRVELECDAKEAVGTRFEAKGHVVIQGPDMNAMVEADECHKAVALLVDKLDRMLSRRAQIYRARRHNLVPSEMESALPKVM
jgi:putative sigma-54 modulation protein